MKKKVLLFLLFAIVVFLNACASFGRAEKADEPFEYVFEFSDVKKADLFTKSKLWVAENFTSAKDVLSFADPETGVLKGTAIGSVNPDLFSRQFMYHFSIETKDGKARLRFSNVQEHSYYSGVSRVKGIDTQYNLGYNLIHQYFDNLAERYASFQKKGDDNW